MTFDQAAEFYNLSPTTIQNWQRRVHSKTTRKTKPYKIPDDVKEHPNDYQYERARRLNCSKTDIYHALKRLGISQKKTLEHPKSCLIKRAKYQSKLDSLMQQGYPIVYMDESGFEHETIRSHGYSLIGKSCIDSYNWQAKKRTNVIGALYNKMLFALYYFEQNINGNIFYNWCKFTLIPSLKTKCVIVVDNARFHKSRRIQNY